MRTQCSEIIHNIILIYLRIQLTRLKKKGLNAGGEH